MNSEISNSLIEELVNSMNRMDKRLTEVETALNLRRENPVTESTIKPVQHSEDDDDALELAIGEFWFAKIGISAFLLGMFFLITQPLDNYPPMLPILIGYLLSLTLILVPEIWLKSFKYISGFLIGGGAALLYLTTLRLHFFGMEPIITTRLLLVILLALVGGLAYWIASRRQSVYLIALSELFFMMTALVTEIPLLIFTMLTLISISVVVLSLRFNSSNLMVFGIIFTFMAHGFWFVNNPLLGHPLLITNGFHYNLIFLLAYLSIYGGGSLMLIKGKKQELDELFMTIMNASTRLRVVSSDLYPQRG